VVYLLALSILATVLVVAVAFRAVGQHETRAQADRDKLLATIDELCQRIQAPDQAVVDYQARQGAATSPPAVGFDDDEDWWRAQEMTKEQLAEHLMKVELGTDGAA
jgi:hypothetical protein